MHGLTAMALPVGVGRLISVCVRGGSTLVADQSHRQEYYLLMASDEDIKALARLVVNNRSLTSVAFGVLNDFARLIEPTVKRCSITGCKEMATVHHVDLQIDTCDHCAAAAIHRAGKGIGVNPSDSLSFLRLCIADEERWVDLPNAEQIRRLREYVQELRKNDEPVPPSDSAELH